MRFKMMRFIPMLMVLLVVSGCNLSSEDTTDPTNQPISSTAQSGAKPTITVVSPNNGSEFGVGDRVLVSVNATDAVGVTRIQLLANGQTVKTISSQAQGGERNMNAVLDYTARATGTVNLSVVAYRAAVASDPAALTLNIRNAQPSVTPTRPVNPNPGVPVIDPTDTTCRAVTNTSLNLRVGPDVSFQSLAVLASGTVVPIVGRLPTNAWWQVRVGSTFGWISGQYVLVYGICTNVPVIAPPVPATLFIPTATRTALPTNTLTTTPIPATATNVPGPADLVISGINGLVSVQLGAGNAPLTENYAVTITNTGQQATGQFTNTITLTPDGSVTPLGVVSGLNPGESILLTVSLTFTSAGTYQLSATTDSDFVIPEQSEVNNLALITIAVAANP